MYFVFDIFLSYENDQMTHANKYFVYNKNIKFLLLFLWLYIFL